MKFRIALAALPLAFAVPLAAQDAGEPVTPDDVVAAATPEEWVKIAAEDLLVMDLAPDAEGNSRRVVIQLMPAPFSQPWVENIRTLARAHWWDGTSVYRAVDNWVVQWGDVSEEKALPEEIEGTKALHYEVPVSQIEDESLLEDLFNQFEGLADLRIHFLDGYDGNLPRAGEYADVALWWEGWPFASNSDVDGIWPIHCYSHVGVARDLAPDTGTGSELYAVIGHAPRQLDRNIAVVGRVIDGMEHLSTLRRGTGDAGVYETREEDTPILQVRLASEIHEIPQPRFEYLSTESESFARYVQVRANRDDDFYTVPAGGVDICNVPVPIRQIPGD